MISLQRVIKNIVSWRNILSFRDRNYLQKYTVPIFWKIKKILRLFESSWNLCFTSADNYFIFHFDIFSFKVSFSTKIRFVDNSYLKFLIQPAVSSSSTLKSFEVFFISLFRNCYFFEDVIKAQTPRCVLLY